MKQLLVIRYDIPFHSGSTILVNRKTSTDITREHRLGCFQKEIGFRDCHKKHKTEVIEYESWQLVRSEICIHIIITRAVAKFWNVIFHCPCVLFYPLESYRVTYNCQLHNVFVLVALAIFFKVISVSVSIIEYSRIWRKVT